MECTSKEQTMAVAAYGAQKMDAQGYRFEKVGESSAYEVFAPGQAVPYLVESDPEIVAIMDGKNFCNCPFAKTNEEFGTCKHYTWLLTKLEEERQAAEDEQAWEDWNDMKEQAIAERVLREAMI